jgi:hypothetical protein
VWKVDCSQDGHRIVLLGKMSAGLQQPKAEVIEKKRTKRFAATGKTWEGRQALNDDFAERVGQGEVVAVLRDSIIRCSDHGVDTFAKEVF